MSGTWPAPDKRFFRILDILSLKQHNDQKKMAITHHAIINTLKHQLSTQRYEPSTAAHVVRKLLTAVVAFGILY
jgi:hypothetical protein